MFSRADLIAEQFIGVKKTIRNVIGSWQPARDIFRKKICRNRQTITNTIDPLR